MIRINQLFLALIAVFVFVSCSEDEDPDPIVGTWTLEASSFIEWPTGYELNEFEWDALYGETSYTIIFHSNGTYERDILEITGFGNIRDEGTYVVRNGEISLDPTSGDSFVNIHNFFDIVGEPNDTDMELEVPYTRLGLENSLWDELSALETFEEQEAYYVENSDEVSMTVRMTFERE